jgi:hypothetical protein
MGLHRWVVLYRAKPAVLGSPFITWLVVLEPESPTDESPFSQKYFIRMPFKDARPEICSITRSAFLSLLPQRIYLSVWFNKWGHSQTADKRGIVTKRNASTVIHPSVTTTQPQKRGCKVVEDPEGHLIKLPDKMYVLHKTSCQSMSNKLADADREAVKTLSVTKSMMFQARG